MLLCTKCGLDMPVELCYDRPGCQNCSIQRSRAKFYQLPAARQEEIRNHRNAYKRFTIRRTEAQLDVWQHWISKIPKDYHTLTEEEWEKVVEYFDGKCAFCQLNDFTLRGMFLTANQGGRYCNWNVIPVCDVCINRPKNKNPFRFMSKQYTATMSISSLRRYSVKKLRKIVEYLEPILLEAAHLGYVQKVPETSCEYVEYE